MPDAYWVDPVLDAAYQKQAALAPQKGKAYTTGEIGAWRAAMLEYKTALNQAGPFPRRALPPPKPGIRASTPPTPPRSAATAEALYKLNQRQPPTRS